MTITLTWWAIPLALVLVAFALAWLWPDEPSGHFSAGGPGILKIGVILLLLVLAAGICFGKALA